MDGGGLVGGSALRNPRKKEERGPADVREAVSAVQQEAAQRRAAARWTVAGPVPAGARPTVSQMEVSSLNVAPGRVVNGSLVDADGVVLHGPPGPACVVAAPYRLGELEATPDSRGMRGEAGGVLMRRR